MRENIEDWEGEDGDGERRRKKRQIDRKSDSHSHNFFGSYNTFGKPLFIGS